MTALPRGAVPLGSETPMLPAGATPLSGPAGLPPGAQAIDPRPAIAARNRANLQQPQRHPSIRDARTVREQSLAMEAAIVEDSPFLQSVDPASRQSYIASELARIGLPTSQELDAPQMLQSVARATAGEPGGIESDISAAILTGPLGFAARRMAPHALESRLQKFGSTALETTAGLADLIRPADTKMLDIMRAQGQAAGERLSGIESGALGITGGFADPAFMALMGAGGPLTRAAVGKAVPALGRAAAQGGVGGFLARRVPDVLEGVPVDVALGLVRGEDPLVSAAMGAGMGAGFGAGLEGLGRLFRGKPKFDAPRPKGPSPLSPDEAQAAIAEAIRQRKRAALQERIDRGEPGVFTRPDEAARDLPPRGAGTTLPPILEAEAYGVRPRLARPGVETSPRRHVASETLPGTGAGATAPTQRPQPLGYGKPPRPAARPGAETRPPGLITRLWNDERGSLTISEMTDSLGDMLALSQPVVRAAKDKLARVRAASQLKQRLVQSDLLKKRHLEQVRLGIRSLGRELAAGAREGLHYPDIEDKLTRALHGENVQLPDNLQQAVQRNRDHIDSLSREMIAAGLAQGDLAITFEKNMGAYINRAYEVHDAPRGWAKKRWRQLRSGKTPELAELYNNLVGLIRREMPQLDKTQIDERIQGLMLDANAAGSTLNFMSSKLAKDLTILKRRKNIHPLIRQLWVEDRSAFTGYARSALKMSHTLSRHKLLTELAEASEGQFFKYGSPDMDRGFTEAIATEGNPALMPLTDFADRKYGTGTKVYTTPEIASVLGTFSNAIQQSRGGGTAMDTLHNIGQNIIRGLYWLNMSAKKSKTIYSFPMTHLRNYLANPLFLVAQGNFGAFTKTGHAHKLLVNQMGLGDPQKFRDEMLELVELGILNEGVRISDLEGAMERATRFGMDKLALDHAKRYERLFKETGSEARNIGKQVRARAGQALEVPTSLYRAEDDVWRVMAYYGELDRYRKAIGDDMPEEALRRHVANIIRDVQPTPSQSPEFVKAWRRQPLVGPFVGFNAEAVRTQINVVRQIAKELKDPRLRHIAMQRALGLTMAHSVLAGTAMAVRHHLDIDRDTDRDFRTLGAPWQKNSVNLYLPPGKEGMRNIDLSYTNPFGQIHDPVMALLAGKTTTEAVASMLEEAAEPYFAPELLLNGIMEVVANRQSVGRSVFDLKYTGAPVYNPEDTLANKTGDIINHMWKATLEPGLVAGPRRAMTAKHDRKERWMAWATGIRVQQQRPLESLGYLARDFKDSDAWARRLFTSKAFSDREQSDKVILAAKISSERQRKKRWDEMRTAVRAAVRMGKTEGEVFDALTKKGLSQKEAASLIYGSYSTHFTSNQALRSLDANRVQQIVDAESDPLFLELARALESEGND